MIQYNTTVFDTIKKQLYWMQYNTTVFDAIQHNRIWYNTIKLHLFRAALLVPSTQLSYNKFTDHTQSVGRWDGKGEEWSLNLSMC